MSDSLLESLDLDNTPELGPVEADRQYTLRINSLKRKFQKEENGGRPYMIASIGVPDEASANDFDIFVGFMPDLSDKTKEAIRSRNDIRAFCKAFALNPANMALAEDFEDGTTAEYLDARGVEARAVLGVKKDKRDGRSVNYVKNYI